VKKTLVYLLCLIGSTALATHNRAGEILYKRIAPFVQTSNGQSFQVYHYAFTVIMYTNDGSNIADRCEQTLHFGDGDSTTASRANGATYTCDCGGQVPCGEIIYDDPVINYKVKKNIYYFDHYYAGPGNFTVWLSDPMRNEGVINMWNSVNQPFYIESYLSINAYSGANTSPDFQFDPIDQACLYKCFYHNPGAFDIDGDSLSYEITTCRGDGGLGIPSYSMPPTGGGYYGIDAVNGILKWCTPQLQGEYNLAFIVREWRKNTSGIYQMVGYVLRDMQVLVRVCNNNPPALIMPQDTCVEAGVLIKKTVIVTDPENSAVVIAGGGGAFGAPTPMATLNPTSATATYTSQFVWQTTCDHIRHQPYINVIKATDQGNQVNLVSFSTFNVRVLPPSVKNVAAIAFGSSMKITWDPSPCNPTSNPIVAYKIYRKNDCSPVTYDPCKTGVDPSLGYTYIGQSAANSTVFIDSNNGNGLVVGQDYGYLVIAQYKDGSQSFASTQVCARLKRDIPILLNVDVLSTSTSTGSIFVRWDRPLTNTGNFDTIAFPGPYQINLKHRAGNTGAFTTVFTNTQNSFYLIPTTFTHSAINTVDSDHEYEVEFVTGTITVGSSQKATSVFLTAVPGDRKVSLQWSYVTPWVNDTFFVYRNSGAGFVLTGSTTSTAYLDTNNVVNRHSYCYRILSTGAYSDPSITHPLLNNSQEVCATAIDNQAPCTPTLNILGDCLAGTVKVEWNNVRLLNCGDDVIKYVLFRKETVDAEYVKLDTITNPGTISYSFDQLNLISSCFAIQAIDSSGNASPLSPDYCVDNCPEFELPNIITLNDDGINDFFKAIRVRQIKEIDLYVYDRWGNLVYKTKDPYFQWNGNSIITKQRVSEGTLFYICDVFEPRVTGNKKRQIKGWVQVVK
jgi:gliding motility-associated-like protein